jgi:hypothetical protein
MAMDSALAVDCAGEPESPTRTVRLEMPEALGVPVIWPLAARLKPVVSVPEARLQVYGVVPPLAAKLAS